jgi:hypothetical protein
MSGNQIGGMACAASKTVSKCTVTNGPCEVRIVARNRLLRALERERYGALSVLSDDEGEWYRRHIGGPRKHVEVGAENDSHQRSSRFSVRTGRSIGHGSAHVVSPLSQQVLLRRLEAPFQAGQSEVPFDEFDVNAANGARGHPTTQKASRARSLGAPDCSMHAVALRVAIDSRRLRPPRAFLSSIDRDTPQLTALLYEGSSDFLRHIPRRKGSIAPWTAHGPDGIANGIAADAHPPVLATSAEVKLFPVYLAFDLQRTSAAGHPCAKTHHCPRSSRSYRRSAGASVRPQRPPLRCGRRILQPQALVDVWRPASSPTAPRRYGDDLRMACPLPASSITARTASGRKSQSCCADRALYTPSYRTPEQLSV